MSTATATATATANSVRTTNSVRTMNSASTTRLDTQADTTDLHAAYADALWHAITTYETNNLAATAMALAPIERATWQVPRNRRLRGAVAIEWMRLHAAVLTATAGTAYDRGRHLEAAGRADRAASLARAAGDGALAARALSLRARVVRRSSPTVALQIAGAAARIAGRSPVRALIAGKVAASAHAAAGNAAGVRRTVLTAWRIMDEFGSAAYGPPGFALDTYSPADLALASAEALTTVGAADEAAPHLDRATELIGESGQTGMIVSVQMAQARAALARTRPDLDEAERYAAEAIMMSAERPAEWVARLARDVSDLAYQRTGHPLDDIVESTAAWMA